MTKTVEELRTTYDHRLELARLASENAVLHAENQALHAENVRLQVLIGRARAEIVRIPHELRKATAYAYARRVCAPFIEKALEALAGHVKEERDAPE